MFSINSFTDGNSDKIFTNLPFQNFSFTLDRKLNPKGDIKHGIVSLKQVAGTPLELTTGTGSLTIRGADADKIPLVNPEHADQTMTEGSDDPLAGLTEVAGLDCKSLTSLDKDEDRSHSNCKSLVTTEGTSPGISGC